MAQLDNVRVGVVGAGTMGRGIAQIAATYGHEVRLLDTRAEALDDAAKSLAKVMNRLVEKGRVTGKQSQQIQARIEPAQSAKELADCGFVIEAIVENLDVKQRVLSEIESHVDDVCIFGTNTSSLPVVAIAAGCQRPERVIGTHFFNPAPLMPLVEIIPSLTTSDAIVGPVRELIDAWGKTTVLAKDTPGFIVNRVARPFYSESLRILEEGIADAATIDWAMKELGGFRMGPFELMDLIGNDVNFTVTKTVFEAFYYEPRYRPSFTQQRLTEANRLGRKTGRGYYDYADGAEKPEPSKDRALGERILMRVLSMLINEAADAALYNVATPAEIDLAMTKGVNYPKGLLAWGEEIGLSKVNDQLTDLQDEYGEDRYRTSALLRRLARSNGSFFAEVAR